MVKVRVKVKSGYRLKVCWRPREPMLPPVGRRLESTGSLLVRRSLRQTFTRLVDVGVCTRGATRNHFAFDLFPHVRFSSTNISRQDSRVKRVTYRRPTAARLGRPSSSVSGYAPPPRRTDCILSDIRQSRDFFPRQPICRARLYRGLVALRSTCCKSTHGKNTRCVQYTSQGNVLRLF